LPGRGFLSGPPWLSLTGIRNKEDIGSGEPGSRKTGKTGEIVQQADELKKENHPCSLTVMWEKNRKGGGANVQLAKTRPELLENEQDLKGTPFLKEGTGPHNERGPPIGNVTGHCLVLRHDGNTCRYDDHTGPETWGGGTERTSHRGWIDRRR